jgi:hypothetical protein
MGGERLQAGGEDEHRTVGEAYLIGGEPPVREALDKTWMKSAPSATPNNEPRPPSNATPPSRTAVRTVISNWPAIVAEALPSFEIMMSAASPAPREVATYSPRVIRLTLMPLRKLALGLAPIALAWRPLIVRL